MAFDPRLPAPREISIKDMRRHWWIKYRWANVTAQGDEDITYLRVGLRPIEQVKEAGEQFDIFRRNYKISA